MSDPKNYSDKDHLMSLHYASDLHLEFPENRQWLSQNPLQGEGGVLLLAGDVMPFGQLDKHKDLLERWSQQYEHVLWIPGNHEYYGGDILERSGPLDEKLAPNLRLVNNTVVYAGNLRILCTTLWSPIGQMNEMNIQRSVNDYHQIRQGNALLHPAHITRLHDASLRWLVRELAQPFTARTVVATHHVPTYMNYPSEFLSSSINQAFAVELHALIETSGTTAWIYGHHHRNIEPFTIGSTQMLTNQLGYVRLGEDQRFNPGAVILIDQTTESNNANS